MPGIKCLGRYRRLFQCISLKSIPGVRKEQRRDNIINQGFIVMPLIDAALADVQAGMNRGGMSGGRRGKLWSHFRNNPGIEHGLEELVFFRVALEKVPAESI